MLPEPFQAAYLVTNIFEKLSIPYFLGGSLASIAHGIVRTTQNADIIADIQPVHIPKLIELLQPDFYLDEEMLRDAVRRRGSLNILHRESLFKVDIFIPKDRPFVQSQFRRARLYRLMEDVPVEARIAAAEDILLAKLEWFRQGGGVSERQWRDVLGIVKVQGEALDIECLRHWAAELQVEDLLEKLLTEE